MKRQSVTLGCTLFATISAAAIAYGFQAKSIIGDQPALAAFEFHRVSAATPEDAAKVMFRGVASESPSHFVQHLLIGVCDGPIDTLQKFAESMHETRFNRENESFSFYELRDLRKGIDYKAKVRASGTKHFNPDDATVAALQTQMLSTYYGESFAKVDVAANGYDGREYQTRIVVAKIGGRWFAMPRCRSASSFYKIADAM